MAPSPISPSTVHRILAHIAPLDDFLPPSLISKPLLKRHHFLSLTLDDAADYLAWPSSSDPAHLLRLLEGPLHDLGDHLDAWYTADSEEFLAHVCISPDLRLVFLWEDEPDGWQYHNLATMPFPPDSVEDFNCAYSYSMHSSNSNFLSEVSAAYEVTMFAGDDDDDSYWDSYGQQPDDSAHHLSLPKATEDVNSEDAYWARYSTIQGSADSTIPSPIPPAKDIKSEVTKDDSSTTDLEQCLERIIVPPPTVFQSHHVEVYNEPPSPGGLTRRLQALSDTQPSTPLIDEPDSGYGTLSPQRAADINTDDTVECQRQPGDDNHDHDHAAFRIVLQDTVKNLYRLWRMSRRDESAEQDRNLFVSAVQRALKDL